MKVERVGEKNVTFTAFEEDSIRVFLIHGLPKNLDEFVQIIQTRVERHKEADRKRKPTTSIDKNEDSFEGTLV